MSHAIRRGSPQGLPVVRLWYDPLERAELYLRNLPRPRSDRRFPRLHRARGFHHDAPEMHDRDIARPQALARTVGDRTHGLPHRHVLIRDAGNSRMAARLHGLT